MNWWSGNITHGLSLKNRFWDSMKIGNTWSKSRLVDNDEKIDRSC